MYASNIASRRWLAIMSALALIASMVLFALPGVAQAGGNSDDAKKNHVGYWCETVDDEVQGTKYDDLESETFTVPAPPEGKVYTIGVVKAGSKQSVDEPHHVVQSPNEGDVLSHPSGKDISHVILCWEDDTTPPPTFDVSIEGDGVCIGSDSVAELTITADSDNSGPMHVQVKDGDAITLFHDIPNLAPGESTVVSVAESDNPDGMFTLVSDPAGDAAVIGEVTVVYETCDEPEPPMFDVSIEGEGVCLDDESVARVTVTADAANTGPIHVQLMDADLTVLFQDIPELAAGETVEVTVPESDNPSGTFVLLADPEGDAGVIGEVTVVYETCDTPPTTTPPTTTPPTTTPTTEPPVDECPNIEGDQSEVPDGMEKDEDGNCVEDTPPSTSPPSTEPPSDTPEQNTDSGFVPSGDTAPDFKLLSLALGLLGIAGLVAAARMPKTKVEDI